MKFIIILLFAFLFSAEAGEPLYLKKGESMFPGGKRGLRIRQIRQAPGIFTVVKSGGGNYLSVTPEKSTIPNNNRVRTQVMSTTKFTAVPGDKSTFP